MQHILESTATGALSIRSSSIFTPPLGLVIPANQTVKAEVPSVRPLSELFSLTSPEIPIGFNVQVTSGTIYAKEMDYWVNEVTSENADLEQVSGVLLITNLADYDIGITW